MKVFKKVLKWTLLLGTVSGGIAMAVKKYADTLNE